MNTFTKTTSRCHKKLIKEQLSIVTVWLKMLTLGLFAVCNNTLHAQSIIQPYADEAIIEGTLHMHLVTDYGENMQKVDYYVNAGEGAFIAFILETDKAIDMTQYLSQEEIEFLSDVDTTMQSEFMIVPDWEVFESFSGKDFATQYAHKRVRVTGTLLCPMAGWRNITLVRMDFSKVEVIE